MKPGRRSAMLAACAASLAACDLVDVDPDVPDLDAEAAEQEVLAAIELFECGYSTFAWVAMGYEDALEPISTVVQDVHAYSPTPVRGECDGPRVTGITWGWFDQLMGTRALISNANGTGVYDRIREKEDLGESRARLSTLSAIYMAAALDHFGEFYCEVALDGGDLLEPDDVLAMAESWVTDRAFIHVAEGGDFALPNGISTSAETMARALRARIRWARGDLAGAAADAAAVPPEFTAWVTREAGQTRQNMVYLSGRSDGFSFMPYPNTLWNPAIRQPNPATGLPWQEPIPFTGYVFLAVLPDGRAVEDGGNPVFWASGRDFDESPIPLNNGATPDPRVPHYHISRSGPSGKFDVPDRYTSSEDDIPLVDWTEMWLIRAEHAGGQDAIDLVNELRASVGIAPVTYIDGDTATPWQIRAMLLEERRRWFFAAGGRYWSTKIQNPDVLWFPRGEGQTGPWPLQGGVRLTMPESEYTANPHLIARGGLAARGTGCDPLEAPVFP